MAVGSLIPNRRASRRGRTPVVKVTGSSNKRVSLAALIAVGPGGRPRLIYHTHHGGRWPLVAGRLCCRRGLVAARASCRRPRCVSLRRCWTLARIAEVVRRRFKVEYTLAGLDLLLHRVG